MNKEVGMDAAAKKRANTSGVGKSNNYWGPTLIVFFGSSIPTSLFILKIRIRMNAKWRFFTSRSAHVNCAIMP